MLQRPEERELAADWLGGAPGRDLPAIFVEHNTPKGDVPNTRHPMADRDDLPLVHVTHFNDCSGTPAGTRTAVVEHGIVTRPPAGPASWTGGRGDQRAGTARRVTGTDLLPLRRDRPAGRLRHGGGRPPCPASARRRIAVYDDLPQARMHAEMARRRAYLHLCRWTSLGLCLIEAMPMGMPVVALATTEAVGPSRPRRGALHPAGHAGPRGPQLFADPDCARGLRPAGPRRGPGPLRPRPVPRPTGTGCWRR